VHFSSSLGTGSQLALPLVGPVFAGIERSPELRRKYLRSFDWIEADSLLMECPPTRDPSALPAVVTDVLGPDDEAPRSPKDTSDRQNILQRLFDRKNP
jgi:hypothetical protein